MKKLTLFLFLIGSLNGFTQTSNTEVALFGQCLFEIQDEKVLDSLQREIALIPYVEMVRLDYLTQRAFIITKNTESLSPEEFTSWFGNYESTIHCIQIGVRGIDPMDTYPFKNCKN